MESDRGRLTCPNQLGDVGNTVLDPPTHAEHVRPTQWPAPTTKIAFMKHNFDNNSDKMPEDDRVDGSGHNLTHMPEYTHKH